jgi:hypothetical protein
MIGKSKTLLLNTWDNLWDPHSSDRFAHDYNAKCKQFYSKFWCPGTAGIDAFRFTW